MHAWSERIHVIIYRMPSVEMALSSRFLTMICIDDDGCLNTAQKVRETKPWPSRPRMLKRNRCWSNKAQDTEHSGSLIEQQLLHLHICTGTRQHSTFGSHLLKPGATLTPPKVTLPRSASCSHVVWQGKPQSYAFYCLIQDIANGNGQFSGSGSLLPGLWLALI